MRLTRGTISLLAASILGATTSLRPAAQEPDLHAIVERDGTVVLCISRDQILFADRCAGTGRLMIVQPIQEGMVTWRTAIGTIVIANDSPQNPDCALSRARWDPKDERGVSSAKRIRKVDPSTVLAQLNKKFYGIEHLIESDFTAFALDLDNDGKDEIIFSASNVRRVGELNDKTGQAYPYAVIGGILSSRPSAYPVFPATFFWDQGTYIGGTDAIGDVVFKGVVPIAIETGDIALLVVNGPGSDGLQDLIRYRAGVVQRIQTIQRRCD
jgi:hypothetical protein